MSDVSQAVRREIEPHAPEDVPLVFMPEITTDNGVGDRGVRKWVKTGKFPEPDGNLNGRNFWKRSTYKRWQQDVFDGKYRRESNLPRQPREPQAA